MLRSSLLLLTAIPVSAQQFVDQPGTFPAPHLWTEAAIPLDANEDGALDVLFVNCQGYASPGDFGAPSANPLPPTIWVQTDVNDDDVPVFSNQTGALLPPGFAIHGKNAAVVDVDGDGHQDLVFAVAFGAQQRLLRKNPNTGRFDDETFRLPSLVLNSFDVSAGDLDDDGDMDLVFTDSGPNTFLAPGGVARLLLNDGTGVFTDETARLDAVPKIGAQNAKLVDIDGDLDLDVVIDGKSPLTHFYENDGTAHFMRDNALLPGSSAPNSVSTYETEWGDFDGDTDLDGMIMNYASPGRDAAIWNSQVEEGLLGFHASTGAIAGSNSLDENEFAFLDADDDGDLDVIIAVLVFGFAEPPSTEKLLINSGTVQPGFLTPVAGAFDGPFDPTLDVAIADFDGDGAYDVVTAQGEFVPYANHYYKNYGPPDSTLPTILRHDQTPSHVPVTNLGGSRSLRAWIQDATVDDGITFVDAHIAWRVMKGNEIVTSIEPMPHIGGHIHRAALAPPPTTFGLVGASVRWSLIATDPAGNSIQSPAQTFKVCGAASYGTGTGLQLLPPPAAVPGGTLVFRVQGPPNASGRLLIGRNPASIPYMGGELLVNPLSAGALNFALDSQGTGEATYVVPDSPLFVDAAFYAQAAMIQGPNVMLSNGVEIRICGS